jgi:adenylate cyclase
VTWRSSRSSPRPRPPGEDAAVRLAYTTGAALARIADAAIATVRARVEAPIRAEGGHDAQVADAFVTVAEALLPLLYPMLEAVHRRHLVQTAHRYSLWDSDPTVESTAHAVIGFADLVGFTALTERVGVIELDDLLMAFEEHVRDAIDPDGARLVKLIGDEALFVAGDVEQAATIARALVRAVAGDAGLPDVRVGMAAGEILVRDGDVFGPAVNRASRLVQVADPATVVVDDSVAGRLPADATSPVGTRELSGIDRPVALYRLTR